MTQEINLGGTIYISSKRAAEITGYAQDYVGQLARGGHIDAQRISGLWYVLEESLRAYKTKADEFKPTPPPHDVFAPDLEATVSFDGKDYISSQRAAKVTGYSPDYVGQLARGGKILSRQIGSRWYVDRVGIVEHKKHNDSLLAAVQADSVGVQRETDAERPENDLQTTEIASTHFNYREEASNDLNPIVPEKARIDVVTIPEVDEPVVDTINEIPIRVLPEYEPVFSKPVVVEAAQNKMSSAPKITMFLLIILVLGVSGFVGIRYMDIGTTVTGLLAKNSIDQASVQSSDRSVPVGNSSSELGRLQGFLAAIFSKEISYARN